MSEQYLTIQEVELLLEELVQRGEVVKYFDEEKGEWLYAATPKEIN
jgi:hypothetical protein